MLEVRRSTRFAYAIFTSTICEGRIPAWRDTNGYPVVFETEHEAQREIVDTLQLQLQEFLDGNRDFEEAMTIEDFILPVSVWPNGSISLQDGTTFTRRT